MSTVLGLAKFRGLLLGSVIGDAMGMPYQFLHPQVVRELFPHPKGSFQRAPEGHVNSQQEKGQYTDESQLLTLVAESIINHREARPEDVAAGMLRLFEEDGWITPGRSVLSACRHLQNGVSWQEAGVLRDGSKPLSFVPPVVLRYFGDFSRMSSLSRSMARIILVDSRVLSGCICYARLLSNLLVCEDASQLDKVVRLTASQMKPVDESFHDMLLWVLSLRGVDVWEGLQELGTGYSILETLFSSLFVFLKYPDDFRQAVSSIVYAGDNADTTGFLTGSFCGAFRGIDGIPESLIDGLKDCDFFLDLADRLHSVSSGCVS